MDMCDVRSKMTNQLISVKIVVRVLYSSRAKWPNVNNILIGRCTLIVFENNKYLIKIC